MRSSLLVFADKKSVKKTFQGIPIVVENPKGSTRTGVGKDGKPWERVMQADYGYIPGLPPVKGGDGEDLDIYMGPDETAPDAYVIEQMADDGKLDEYKVCLGFESEAEAVETYLKHYPEGWMDHVGEVWSMPVSRLRTLCRENQT